MKLLFDQNLSHHLTGHLADVFPEASHVVHLGLEHADDDLIWVTARRDGYMVVTKDTDFHDETRFPGPPPKLIHLALGNGPTRAIEVALRSSAATIQDFGRNDRRVLIVPEPDANSLAD